MGSGGRGIQSHPKEIVMLALVMLLLIIAIFGGFGFAAHFLWIVLVRSSLL
jgi:hypothetical protein